jgi:hypothetical protein
MASALVPHVGRRARGDLRRHLPRASVLFAG